MKNKFRSQFYDENNNNDNENRFLIEVDKMINFWAQVLGKKRGVKLKFET